MFEIFYTSPFSEEATHEGPWHVSNERKSTMLVSGLTPSHWATSLANFQYLSERILFTITTHGADIAPVSSHFGSKCIIRSLHSRQ